jgi:2-polyprenyl-3-methyl-5-hydroxy-6-metoxy-1,4-benzoquinol methylase
MNKNFEYFRDPETGLPLTKNDDFLLIKNKRFKIINDIPRFVSSINYSADFGFQWNTFPKTQLDSYSGLNISEKRLSDALNLPLNKLKGKYILEAGSGAGRFTEILIKYGAIVHSFDYSNAVEANSSNNGENEEFLLAQADIMQIPYQKKFYDFVICLGVIQHTPNSKESILSLWTMLKPGGALVFDHYMFSLKTFLPPPFGQALEIYRFFILKFKKKYRFKIIKKIVDFWFPIHWKFKKNYFMTRILRRLSPVIFYYGSLPLKDKNMHYEWSLLDTHDSTTDYYRNLTTFKKIKKILNEIGAANIVFSKNGNGICVSCMKEIK